MMYVTLQEAKDHVGTDHDEDDCKILSKIEHASSVVKNYLKAISPYEPQRDADDTPLYDSNGFSIKDTDLSAIRYEVRAATLIMIQRLYDQDFELNPNYPPAEVVALLYPIRDPALA